MKKQELNFRIISCAGSSISTMQEAIVCARTGDLDRANQKLVIAKEELLEAQRNNKKIIEVIGYESHQDLLDVHAQDTLMNAVFFELIVEDIINLYSKNIKSV